MSEYGFFGLLWESSLVIKVVFVVLAGMSVSTWSLIFYKWWELRGAAASTRAAGAEVERASSVAEAVSACAGEGPACEVVRAGSEELDRLRASALATAEAGRLVLDSLRHTLSDAAQAQSERLFGSLSYLSTCAAAAPLLGLFGTVWGIMSSFSSITGGTGGVAEVAPGLAEALGTTAAGLMVAIPAVLAYNLFLKMLASTESGLFELAGTFLNRVKADLPDITACAPQPGPRGES